MDRSAAVMTVDCTVIVCAAPARSLSTEQGPGDVILPPLVTEPVRPGDGVVFKGLRATVQAYSCYQVASLQDTVPKYDDV